MRKLSILLCVSAIFALANCGNKTQQQQFEGYADTVGAVMINTNHTVFGLCGDATNDSILQLITDSGDTLALELRDAQMKDSIFGQLEAGFKVAVLLNEERTGVRLVISETQLQGNWVMPNPLDGSSYVGVSLKEGGIAESIEQSYIFYKAWRIVDGKLEITLVREGGGDEEETNLYDIIKLDSDSLIYGNDDDRMEYSRSL
jgi:hypothetical protein